jgi:hypothetical protein
MTWKGHWHGYGPWIGQRSELNQEHLRRPGTDPNSEQTRGFIASALPPLMTGHALLKRSHTAPDRTWTSVEDAITWLTGIYTDRPPLDTNDGQAAYGPLDRRIQVAREDLAGGSDTVWAYYGRNGAFVSYDVVCCPSSYFHPDIPCPLPPR